MEENRRVSDVSALTKTGQAAHSAVTTVWDWAEKRKIAAHAVMVVTIWLTIRIAEWAIDLPYDMANMYPEKYTGVDVAAMLAGVLTPWGLMQGAMFTFYLRLIGANGNGETK